jgi:hypothetical protein
VISDGVIDLVPDKEVVFAEIDRVLVGLGYREIEQGEPVDTFARSKFEDTRRKAAKFGAMGSTIRATKSER